MAWKIQLELGTLTVDETVLARVSGAAAMEVFGIVGMASKQALRDGLSELLGMENLAKGVYVTLTPEGAIIDMHVVVRYGTKISEVAKNVQARVHYVLSQTLGIDVQAVNVHVENVQYL
ncbi:MAG: putative alkaline-shock protein [Candidatus Carbobacillus altaicus]|uniref:Putative alkaline-shock protein n=1 Tax=Candidatus Carbonibacillus altaicus TaxID=2163959 RepID=A0A2R6Y139_9BACL|nr:MAG: putative alkaline-shock protein [Candidatus Carbobacillus altaicus]